MNTRRQFLVGSLSAGALFGVSTGCRPRDPLARPSGRPNLTVGVLSDIHINAGRLEQTLAPFRRALEYFRDEGADAVLIAGDMADSSNPKELEGVGRVWREVFPDNKAPDGRVVEKLFLYGNHDMFGALGKEREAAWERCFGEKFAPIYAKTVKGYTFICAHWGCEGGLPDFLKAHQAELAGTKPFFYAQHPHPYDTCSEKWAWGHDNGTSTKCLSAFPNAVAFSGHSHYPLTDERVVWQGAFTSIGTSSLSYSSTDYLYRENMPRGARRDPRPLRMNALSTGDGKQGLLLDVYDDCICLKRREFVKGLSLGDDWVVPVPVPTTGETPYYAFAPRAAQRTAPAFDAGAVATVKADEKAKKWIVTFPGARTRNKCRVFEYEVTAIATAEDVETVAAQRRVMAKDYYQPDSETPPEGECHFAWEDLPQKMPLRFEVRPMECFGRKGDPIRTTNIVEPKG